MDRRSAVGWLGAAAAFAATPARAQAAKQHRLALQVTSDDKALMIMAIDNIHNAYEHYRRAGASVAVELIAFGPGLAMLREDISPVKDRLARLHASAPGLVISACENTRKEMERLEGKPIELIALARPVPSATVRLIELQEQGWSYIRP